MAHKAIKQAKNTFHAAIRTRADYFDSGTIRRAESLLIQAWIIADSDPVSSKGLADEAEQIALDSIARTESEKAQRKGIFGSEVASLIQELFRHKKTLEEIKKKVNKPTYLIISQLINIADVCIRQAKEGLDREYFDQFPELSARSRQSLSEVTSTLSPVLEQLNYNIPFKELCR